MAECFHGSFTAPDLLCDDAPAIDEEAPDIVSTFASSLVCGLVSKFRISFAWFRQWLTVRFAVHHPPRAYLSRLRHKAEVVM